MGSGRESDMIIGIIDSADERPGLAERWPQDAYSSPLISPPAPASELGRTADLIFSTSIASPFEAVRTAVGSGPAVFRVVVTQGTESGEGAAAIAAEPGTGNEAIERAKEALSWVGSVEVVSEDMLDILGALARGGAAFLSQALQGLEDGAVRDGMPRDTARSFAHHTLLATALLVQDSGSPADLKDQVASPGGTTIAALASLEDAAVRGAFIRAVQTAAHQGRAQRDAARTSMVDEGRAK